MPTVPPNFFVLSFVDRRYGESNMGDIGERIEWAQAQRAVGICGRSDHVAVPAVQLCAKIKSDRRRRVRRQRALDCVEGVLGVVAQVVKHQGADG